MARAFVELFKMIYESRIVRRICETQMPSIFIQTGSEYNADSEAVHYVYIDFSSVSEVSHTIMHLRFKDYNKSSSKERNLNNAINFGERDVYIRLSHYPLPVPSAERARSRREIKIISRICEIIA